MSQMDSTQSENTSNNFTLMKRLGKVYNKIGIFMVLIVMVVVLSFLTPEFLSYINITNVLRQITFIAIIGLGATAIIVTRGIDLSPGSIVGITSVVVASVAHPNQYPLVVTLLIGLLVGTLAGLINGSIVAFSGIPPFIVTLGMYTAARGAAMLYCDGRPVNDLSSSFVFLGQGKLFGIPVPVIVLVIMAIITHIMLTQTKFGRNVFALGGNEQAAIISGVNVRKIKILVYTFAGFLASLAGVLLTARIASGQSGLGVGFELDAIAAAVIGGTSLSEGGVGTIFGTVSGALVIGVINNGMDLLNINAYWQQIVKGMIIVLAVIIDSLKYKKSK